MSLVQQLHHLSTQVDDVGAAFGLFHTRLGLPVAWPVTEFDGFTSGGVRCGNVSLELFHSDRDDTPQLLSFQVDDMAGVGVELDNRGLAHGEDEVVSGPMPDGSEGPILTRMRLNGNFAGTCGVQLVALHLDQPQNPPTDSPNPLGVLDVPLVRIGHTDPRQGIDIWQRLFVPTMFNGTTWLFDEGPALSVEPCGDDELIGVMLRVESVEAASQALHEHGIEEDADHLRENGIGLAGVRFFLTAD